MNIFRRSNKLAPPPESPELNEIMEDMKTFECEKPAGKIVRILPDASSSGVAPDRVEWWQAFETFQRDVEQINDIKIRVSSIAEELLLTSTELTATSEDVKTKIEKSLQKFQDETQDMDKT